MPDNVPVPRLVDPLKKVTVPVGVPDAVTTVAVKVTLCPTVEGFNEDVMDVVVTQICWLSFTINAS